MKKSLAVASWIASAALMLAAVPGFAAGIDINVIVPGVVVQPQPVYVQPRPVYILPQYEHDWRERQLRAVEWRDSPHNHGHAVSAAAHERNDAHKKNDGKHHGKGKNKHGH
jgi:hypothetical protein